MSRSKRKTPITGITTAETEKKNKSFTDGYEEKNKKKMNSSF